MLFITLYLLLFMPDLDSKVVDLIKDAQATNLDCARSGSANFHVSNRVGSSRTTQAVGSFVWKANKGMWTFRLSDPDHLMTAPQDSSCEVEVEKAPIIRVLLADDRIYYYNTKDGVVHIHEFKRRRPVLSTFVMINLFPETLWGRCCPPHQAIGRPWGEMLDPNSPASQPDSTHELTTVSPMVYRHVRVDPTHGKLITDYSLEFAGYPIRCDYESASTDNGSDTTRYRWQKIGRAVVLAECERKEMVKGDPSKLRRSYLVRLNDVDLTTSVPDSKFSPQEFLKLLP